MFSIDNIFILFDCLKVETWLFSVCRSCIRQRDCIYTSKHLLVVSNMQFTASWYHLAFQSFSVLQISCIVSQRVFCWITNFRKCLVWISNWSMLEFCFVSVKKSKLQWQYDLALSWEKKNNRIWIGYAVKPKLQDDWKSLAQALLSKINQHIRRADRNWSHNWSPQQVIRNIYHLILWNKKGHQQITKGSRRFQTVPKLTSLPWASVSRVSVCETLEDKINSNDEINYWTSSLEKWITVPSQSSGIFSLNSPLRAFTEWLEAACR